MLGSEQIAAPRNAVDFFTSHALSLALCIPNQGQEFNQFLEIITPAQIAMPVGRNHSRIIGVVFAINSANSNRI